jgi:hypothetical protein
LEIFAPVCTDDLALTDKINEKSAIKKKIKHDKLSKDYKT